METAPPPNSNPPPIQPNINVIPTPQYIFQEDAQNSNTIFEVNHPLLPPPERGLQIRKYLDVLLFLVLLVGGFLMNFFTQPNDYNGYRLMGGLLFNGGITPLIVSCWAVATGTSMFRRRNFLKSLTSATVFIIGIVLFRVSQTEDSTTIGIIGDVGGALFEIGALFFISKFFFLVEDTEWQINRLEKDLVKALRSPGTGMALSYFYNFVVPTAANLRTKEEDGGKTPIDMEIARGQFEPYTLVQSELIIFVPRNLEGSDMKGFIRDITNQKKVVQGKPKEKPGKGTHRPMFVYFMDWNTENKTCNGLFDIPTIISSIWDRAIDQRELEVDIKQQILDFQNRLIELVAANKYTKDTVRVISLPQTPLVFDVLKQAGQQILLSQHQGFAIEKEEAESGFKRLRKRLVDNKKDATFLPVVIDGKSE